VGGVSIQTETPSFIYALTVCRSQHRTQEGLTHSTTEVPIQVAPSHGLLLIRVGKPEAAKELWQKALADERISRSLKTNFEAKLRFFTTPKNRR